MRERDWLPRGSKHWCSKLTEDDVRLILELNELRLQKKAELDELSQSKIAEKFGISKQRVWEICSAYKGAWRHV
jgi:predicted DNA-binding protein (UPF0251 family)